MKNVQFARYARFAIRIAAFYFSVMGVCQIIQAQSELGFRLVHDTTIVVPVMADGQGPFDFILDTGADTTIVDSALANRLSLHSQAHIPQTTLAGVQTVNVSSLAGLTCGPAHVGNLPVLVEDLAKLRKMDSSLEGILGQDFLSHFNYLLDYRKHSLRIEQSTGLRDGVEGDPVTIEVNQKRMIVSSEAQSAGRAKVDLMLDSGANSVVLLPTAVQALRLESEEKGFESTSNGTVEVRMGRVRELTVGSQQFRNLVVALSRSEPAERIGDGLLPTSLFKVLYVNNHEGFVIFNPRLKGGD